MPARFRSSAKTGDPACRAKLGFLPEQPYFNMYLIPRKLLAFYGSLFGLALRDIAAEAARLLALAGLEDTADVILSEILARHAARVGFAQAMLNSAAG